jgi:eukaryotic-like serine/threonine-protein kinase
MTPERWAQVNEVLYQAMRLAAEERVDYLDHACAADSDLRREVESLLAADEQARSSFLQSAPLGLIKGTRLGDYDVLAKLGAGGMGEVYRALDVRLRREVAIKVLPGFRSSDPERLRRFEQEAMATAALNHPNILAVYQMGTHQGAPYLVSELLEGETLREQIKRGRIALRKAIDYGVQIAHGLAAAHEKGIVHRDLKPENLFITKGGRAKILDFGLAKLQQPHSNSAHSALTLGSETEPGMVMGTVGYMSPEQVRGETADHRADIFAFGTILYEMLTGQRAFHKPTSAETMAAILNEEPPPILQTNLQTPPGLQRVVRRCLEKNPEQRFQSASDLAFALDALSDSGKLSASNVAVPASYSRRRFQLIIVAAGVVAVALITATFLYLHRPAKRSEKDTIVLADFANSTGDPIFDDTLKQALTTALRQSPFLNVLSDNRVTATLRLMTRPPNTPLTPDVTREICQRADGKAWIQGSIASIGAEYIIGLKAVNCQSGDILAQEQVTAAGKEQVLDTLGQAASQLRRELGETLASVQKFDVPLRQATTSSLDALKALSVGDKLYHEKGMAGALPSYEHAIELDPQFASAYVATGTMYVNLREYRRARELFAKAYSLRERTSELEKFTIESRYYVFVTGELDNAARVFREWLGSYPNDRTAFGNLGHVYSSLGQHQQALDFFHEDLQRDPNNVIPHMAYAMELIALNRFTEARATLQDALDKKLDSTALHLQLYQLNFLAGDSAGMAEQVAWSNRSAEARQRMLPLEAAAEAYAGHLHKSDDLSHQAIDLLHQSGRQETPAAEVMSMALREASFGDLQETRKTALSIPQAELGVDGQALGALALATAGDLAHAESLLNDLVKQYPKGTLVQFVVAPTVQARIELSKSNPERSIQLLHPAELYELTNDALGSDALGSCVYPAYVRGQAYLAFKDGAAAEAEFRKILDHTGLVSTCETGALARLGLAQALALQGAKQKAKTAYEDFFTLWKDADPDIPILKQAKAEYSSLQ